MNIAKRTVPSPRGGRAAASLHASAKTRHRVTAPAVALPPGRGGGNRPPVVATSTTYANLIAVTSISGGLGASTVSAMLAAELGRRNDRCALIDADFEGGGMDVLLGVEGESGLRFGTVDAPLGRIDGDALDHELPHWEHVGVLACNPWNDAPPGSWEVEAVIRALCEVNRIVVMDVGRGPFQPRFPGVAVGAAIVLVELSVLGLARGKARLPSIGDASGKGMMVVGVCPHGAGGKGVVSRAEAEDYLGMPITACLRYDRRLHDDMLAGLGIRAVRGRNRRAVCRLADRVRKLVVQGDTDG